MSKKKKKGKNSPKIRVKTPGGSRYAPIRGKWETLPDGTVAALDARGYLRTKEKGLVHRLIHEKEFGGIPPGWVVHHVDFNKTNNEPRNLVALPNEFHEKIHKEMKELREWWGRTRVLEKLRDFLQAFAVERDRMLQAKRDYESFMQENRALIVRYEQLKLLSHPSPLQQLRFDETALGLEHLEKMRKVSVTESEGPTWSKPKTVILRKEVRI